MLPTRLRDLLATAAVLLLLTGGGLAQPRTPPVFVNEKIHLVELARSQRATLRYDLRPIAGSHLKVDLYRYDQTIDEKPVKEWIFHSPEGSERITFEGLPLAVYTMIAYCSDEEGRPLALAAPLIHVQYGGWRAWEKFQPPIETVTTTPDGFEEVEVATSIRNRDVGIGLNPPAVVLKPGQSITFTSAFRNMDPEPLEWKLVGEGKLEAIDKHQYVYTAPADQFDTRLFRIEIQSPAHPDLTGGATILVTNTNMDGVTGN